MGVAALHTEHLTKRFGRLVAVDGLDLTVEAGEVFGFLGPNGAGKSTTIRLALGLVRPTASRVRTFDADAADVRHRRHAGHRRRVDRCGFVDVPASRSSDQLTVHRGPLW